VPHTQALDDWAIERAALLLQAENIRG